MFSFTIILLLIATVCAKNGTDIPQVDHVISSLLEQHWDEDEAVCRQQMFSWLDNVKNSTLWATWMWDSIPKSPTGVFYGARFFYGNYDQCLRPPRLLEHPELRTQYCLAQIEMSKAEDPFVKNWDLPGPYRPAEEYYIDSGTYTGRSFSLMSYGVCLPAGCQQKSAARLVRALLRGQHLRAAWDAPVGIHHCEQAGDTPEAPTGYHLYTYTFMALAVTALAATYYISLYPDRVKRDTFVNHVAKSFCLRRNYGTLFKEEKDALPCMDGIRFLTACFIVYIHIGIYSSKVSIANSIDLDRKLRTFKSGIFLVNSTLFVDIFFGMAGLLVGRSLTSMNLVKPYNLLKFIIRRYIRLVIAYAVAIFYIACTAGMRGDGPVYPKMLELEQETCQKNWWVALLMLGNYVNIGSMCLTTSWSVPSDFHMYTITLVLYYIYQKKPRVGKAIAAVVVFLGLVGPAINCYIYNLPATFLFNIGMSRDLRYQPNFLNGYVYTHIRMGPYIAGLLVGYQMSVYKPANYKNIWSKTSSFLGVCLGLAVMLSVFAVGYLCYEHRVYGLLACLYRIFNRTVFTMGVLSIIVFCTYSDVPLVNSLLSWYPFRVLSRLTYTMYLIHAPMIFISKFASRSHLRFYLPDVMIECCGTIIKALIFALVVWLFVEGPLVNITNKYLVTRSESKNVLNMEATRTNQNVIENNEDKPKVM